LKDGFAAMLCADVSCTDGEKTTYCCEEKGTCTAFLDTDNGGAGCSATFAAKSSPAARCADTACTETECCDEVFGTCTAFLDTDNGGTGCSANFVAKSSPPANCAAFECTETECCDEKALCSTLDCDNEFGTAEQALASKASALMTHCAALVCAAADEQTCCENRATCDDMVSGDGKVYCDLPDGAFAGCGAAGLAPEPSSRECAGGMCTKSVCCNSKPGGLPPQETTRAETTSTVVEMVMKVTGLMLSSTTEAQKTSLKDAFCSAAAASTGISKDQCVAVLTAGSIVGTTTLTAPAGTNVGAVETPAPADVLTAVKAIDGITDAQTPGMDIGVADIQAVIFREGETEAQNVPPPVAPTPPAPPPATTTAEDETDAAVGKFVPALLLPLMMLAHFA
jgi:hypothetical protein